MSASQSKSRSDSATSNVVNDSRVGASDSAVVIAPRGNRNIVQGSGSSSVNLGPQATLTTYDLSADVAKAALTANSDVNKESFKTIAELVKSQADLTLGLRELDGSVLQRVITGTQDSAQQNADALALAAQTKITDGGNLNQKTTLVALGIGGAVLLFSLMKRK